jgi:predicted MPP superfamily phosphohydrolase
MLPAGSTPVRIGFVSDLHLGPTTPASVLDAAFEHLARADLDLLLLGGDYVFLDATEAKAMELVARVRAVPARRRFAVLGNHDLWTRHAILERALEGAGVELVLNRSVALDAGAGRLTLVGIDEPWTGDPDVERAFEGARSAEAIVVLCHSPDAVRETQAAVEQLPLRPQALYLCGHTHGGHVATPWGPIFVPGPLGREYSAGLYQTGPMQIHVSRGVGATEVAVRTYARPDVAVFDLVARA